MRTKKSFWIIIAAFALCATPIQAQGFGSILKKAKKVLTPSNEPAKTEAPQAKPAASNAAAPISPSRPIRLFVSVMSHPPLGGVGAYAHRITIALTLDSHDLPPP